MTCEPRLGEGKRVGHGHLGHECPSRGNSQCKGLKAAVCLGYFWSHGGGQCGLEQRCPDEEQEKMKPEKSQGTQITEDFVATVNLGFCSEWTGSRKRALSREGT